MAVIISNGATTLATASGFYRVEAYNLGMFSTTDLSLSSDRTFDVTFANAGNCQGCVIALATGSSGTSLKSVTVTLQENVAAVWTDRATVTLSAATITNGTADGRAENWIVPFTGGTFPYAVTTAGSTWRFKVSNATGTNNWSIRTSDATNPFYATWCDNAVSFASNDVVIAKDIVTIDMTATWKGVLGTGDTTRSVCAIACKSSTPTPANVHMFLWENPAVASYTLTIDGFVVMSAHSGFRIGTSGSPIAFAQKAKLNVIAATSGTSTNTGIVQGEIVAGGGARKSSFFAYGEIPAVEDALLANDVIRQTTVTMTIASPCVVTYGGGASHFCETDTPIVFTTTGALPTGLTAGTTYYLKYLTATTFHVTATPGGTAINTSGSQSGTHTVNSVIVTTTSTGWAVGDTIQMGRSSSLDGAGAYTIATISGTTITVTGGNLNGRKRRGGAVINFNNYGVEIFGPVASYVSVLHFPCASNFYLSGVRMYYAGFNGNGQAIYDDAANMSNPTVSHCSSEFVTSSGAVFVSAYNNETGWVVDHFNCYGTTAFGTFASGFAGSYRDISITNCISIRSAFGGYAFGNHRVVFSGNHIDNQNNSTAFNGVGVTSTNNSFYGSSYFRPTTLINYRGSGNYYNSMTYVWYHGGTVIDFIETNSYFGNLDAITTYAWNAVGDSYADMEFNSCTGVVSVNTTTSDGTPRLLGGSKVKIVDDNDVSNIAATYTPDGNWVRCGTGLSDTTARTSGGYSIRLNAITVAAALGSAIDYKTMSFPYNVVDRAIPTGNIQNSTMTVSIWVYINNTAYDAGTYEYPKLYVKYDDATTTSATATATFGSWQQLSVTFTPTTTFGQIEVWVTTKTDATGSNAYVYLDDFNVAYPSGAGINLGAMDLWAHAQPVWPPIATVALVDSLWNSQTSAHTSSGTFGKLVGKLLTVGKFLGLK